MPTLKRRPAFNRRTFLALLLLPLLVKARGASARFQSPNVIDVVPTSADKKIGNSRALMDALETSSNIRLRSGFGDFYLDRTAKIENLFGEQRHRRVFGENQDTRMRAIRSAKEQKNAPLISVHGRSISLERLALEDTHTAIQFTGDSSDINFAGLSIENVDYGITNIGSDNKRSTAISNINIQDVTIRGANKGGIRLAGVTNSTIKNVIIDGLGRKYSKIVSGLNIESGRESSNIKIQNVTSRNWETRDDSDHYWNGDCFTDERECHDLEYVACVAHGAPDGGFDLKSSKLKLVDCSSTDCKFNYRLWGAGVTLENCSSINPRKRGGLGPLGGHFHINNAKGVTARNYRFDNLTIVDDSHSLLPVFDVVGPTDLSIEIYGYDLNIHRETPLIHNRLKSGAVLKIVWWPPFKPGPEFEITLQIAFVDGVPGSLAIGEVVASFETESDDTVYVLGGGGANFFINGRYLCIAKPLQKGQVVEVIVEAVGLDVTERRTKSFQIRGI